MLIPSTVINELWSILSARRIQHKELPYKIKALIEQFMNSPNNVNRVVHRTHAITEYMEGGPRLSFNIKWEPFTVQDLEGIEHVIDTIGLNDAIMINIAKRLNAYLLTTEKASSKGGSAFIRHALRRGVKVMTPCSWALARYYRVLTKKYVKSESTEDIIGWLFNKRHGEKRQKDLVNRFQYCEGNV